MVRIVVGAGLPLDFIEEARKNPELTVYAFEPNKDMASKYTNLPNNYKIIYKAVSNFTGTATFNISNEFTCSSLKQFTSLADELNYKHIKTVEVPVIRLDEFLEENNVDLVDYLVVDAQGADYEVIEGLGHKLDIIKKGQVESMAIDDPDTLYEGQKDYHSLVNLLGNGFDFRIINNDGGLGNREINLIFIKKEKDVTVQSNQNVKVLI